MTSDPKLLIGILLAFSIISGVGIWLGYADASLPPTPPPTPAYKYFYDSAGNNITALNYSSKTTFLNGTGMTVIANYTNNTITFSAIAGTGSGNATILDELGDVIISSPLYHSILAFDGSNWIDKLFALNKQTCGGTDKISAIDNVTGVVTCSADSTGSITTLESLTNVTDGGCGDGQVRKASGGNWICADDSTTGSLSLDDLTDVIITAGAYGDILFHNGIAWIDKAFMLNSITCGGTQKISAINNVTGAITCTDDQEGPTGATTLDSLTDVTITAPAYGDIIQYNQALTLWVNKLFRIDTQVAQPDFQVTGINNQTGAITTNQFSVNTVTSPAIDFQVYDINNVTGQVKTNQFSVNTLTSPAIDFQVYDINNATGQVKTNQFSVNLKTCGGTDKVSSIDNATGNVICSADTTGAGISSINADTTTAQFIVRGGAGNITVVNSTDHRLINTGYNVLVTGGSAQVFTKNLDFGVGTTQKFPNAGIIIRDTDSSNAFTIQGNGLVANKTVTIPASTITSSNFAIDKFANDFNGFIQKLSTTFLMRDSDSTHGITIASPNLSANITVTMPSITSTLAVNKSSATGDLLKGDGTNYLVFPKGSAYQFLRTNAGATNLEYKTFRADTTTCSGTDKVSAYNNQTGAVTCSGGAGGGIPLPPKKWGRLTPISATADLDGLTNGCTILPTATYVYDVTDASAAILSTTAVTDGVNGGIHCTGTDRNVFTGAKNAYMYSRWEENKVTTNRIFIGFSGPANTILPNNAETIVDSIDAAGLCIRTTDSVYQFCSNDGTGAGAYATLTTSEDTGVHFFEVYTTDSGVTWCGKLDGGTAVCSSTAADIPTTTDRLFAQSTGETDGGATAILWTQYNWYIESGR